MDNEMKAALRKFGRKNNPIRMSSLPMTLVCPGFQALRLLEEDSAGIAAINGTCIGRAIELWHNGEGEPLKKALEESPTAEAPLMEQVFDQYIQDPRNGELAYHQVLREYQEQEVVAKVRGKSGLFFLKGHVDQVRRCQKGKLWIWDLKNGSMYGGNQMINVYAAQQVAYAVGMSDLLGEPVGYGGIIRLRGYIGRNNLKLEVEDRPVFFEAMWSEERCRLFMKQITNTLDSVRRGQIQIAPGSQCGYCPAGGVYNCVDQF